MTLRQLILTLHRIVEAYPDSDPVVLLGISKTADGVTSGPFDITEATSTFEIGNPFGLPTDVESTVIMLHPPGILGSDREDPEQLPLPLPKIDDTPVVTDEQPAPSGGTGDVWAELISDEESLDNLTHPLRARLLQLMRDRRALGIARYGQPLRRGDGRDHRRDLQEELLDALVYARASGEAYAEAAVYRALLHLIQADLSAALDAKAALGGEE